MPLALLGLAPYAGTAPAGFFFALAAAGMALGALIWGLGTRRAGLEPPPTAPTPSG